MMSSGNSLAMVVPFLVAPIITRLYAPSDFAGFELYVKFLSLFAVVASLRYELAIVLPAVESEARALVRLCLSIVLVATALSMLPLLFRHSIGEAFNNTDLPGLLLWLPIGVLLTGLYSIALQSAIRDNKFRLISTNKIANTAANNGVKLLMGRIHPSSAGLVYGHLFGMLVSVVGLMKNRSVRQRFRPQPISKAEIKNLVRKYRDFPLYNATHAFFDEGYKTVLFLMISVSYGEIILGLFAFTFRYLRVPLLLLGSALSNVIFPRLSEMYREGKVVRPLISRTIVTFLIVGFIPFLLIFIFGPSLFGFVFGAEWATTGTYAQIMTPWLYLNFVTSPVSILPTVLGKQRLFFLINLIGILITLAVVFGMMWMVFDFITVLMVISAMFSGLHIVLMFWFLRISRFQPSFKSGLQ